MTAPEHIPHPKLTDAFTEAVVDRLKDGERIRRHFLNGRIHIDRPLPFLCVHRRPPGVDDDATASLVLGEGSYLIAPAEYGDVLHRLVAGVTGVLADRFQACLLVEIWSSDSSGPRPTFRVYMPDAEEWPSTVRTLASAVETISLPWLRGEVEVEKAAAVAPPGMQPLLSKEDVATGGRLLLGLEVPSVYRDRETGTIYPAMLRALRRELSGALQKAFFEFISVQSNFHPLNYHALGRQAVLRKVWEADRQLAEIDGSFNLLLAVTPVNTEEAWEAFRGSNYEEPPVFHYRLLTFDPHAVKQRLYQIELDEMEDPTITYLFRQKRIELDRKLTMLESRDTRRFLYDSMQLYDPVSDELLRDARRLLAAIDDADGDAPSPGGTDDGAIDAEEFAARARREIALYNGDSGRMTAEVEIRRDIPSLMVSRGNLLISRRLRLSPERAAALLQHEVGTHVVTYFNGRAQPMKLLATGLPRYDALQEGLAVLAEHLTGGLTPARLRLLAARVVAVAMLTRDAGFIEIFRTFSRDFGFNPYSAFTITMRVYRGGGFTKDAVYLRGLVLLLDYLAAGNSIDPLFTGKISLDDVPVIEELLSRGVLEDPPFRPRFLDAPGAQDKLDAIQQGHSVLNLV